MTGTDPAVDAADRAMEGDPTNAVIKSDFQPGSPIYDKNSDVLERPQTSLGRDQLQAAVDRVRRLHVCSHPMRATVDDPWVYPCDQDGERLPCATIRALDS